MVLGTDGSAWVELPEWFEAVNTGFRYQLTPIGASAPGLYVASEISGNRFRVAGGTPGLKVSWTVIARRNDPTIRRHPFDAEPEKPEAFRGRYVDPEAYGQPLELQIGRREPMRLPPEQQRLPRDRSVLRNTAH